MSQLKYCQGPKCHTYDTKDRKKGAKDNKRNETRRRSSFHYLGGNACGIYCERDWYDTFGTRAVDHFGRITEPKVLTSNNAWRTRRNWNHHSDQEDTFYVHNYLTDERRPITEQQYDNENIITHDGQLNI